MKRLFVYYSHTGNGDLLAKAFEENGYEIRKVRERKKMPKSFFLQMMSGGFRAGLKLKGKLVDYDNDVSGFDEIVIGSPIWNGAFPPATNAVLASTDFADKKLSFLLYSGSGEGKKAKQRIDSAFPEAKVLFLQEPKKYPKQLEKLEVFFDKPLIQ